MKEYIDGQAFKDMILYAASALEANRQTINELNVFPVPDGDTGTNMSLTLNSAAAELRKNTPPTIGKAAEITSAALLRGARGNSGVILSLLFRGISRVLKDKQEADATILADAMSEGVSAAYKAVMKPAEGTILTVSRLSAERAKVVAAEGAVVEATLSSSIKAAKEALANTVNQNPVLKKAGVIDAGGKGYVIILEAMLASLRGEKAPEPESSAADVKEKADFSDFNTEDITFTYCTEFIVERENDKDPQLLRNYLSGIGDSIVVVDDDEIIKVHVHTNVPGAVLTEALTYGCFLTTKIENMRKQHTATIADSAEEKAPAAPEKKYGLISVCAGAGMEAVFRDLGVDALVSGGQTMNPSTEDILKQIEKTPAEIIFVLPNNKNIIMAAEQCDALTDKKVVVIPSTTIPQGVAALLDFDPTQDEETIENSMSAALARVHTVQVTYAARDSEYDGHEIKEGDYLALLEGKLIGIEKDLDALIAFIGDSLVGMAPEYVTVFYGSDVSEDTAKECAEKLGGKLSDAEMTLVSGGQPVYYFIISAE